MAQAAAAGTALGEHEAQFVLGMGGQGHGSGFDADAAEQPLGAMVEQPIGRVGDAIKPVQGGGGPEGNRQGALDGKPFWPQFAQDDLQESDQGKTDGKGDVRLGLWGSDADPIERRPEQGGEQRPGEPAQPQAGHGDAQLGGAEIGSQVLQDVPGQARAAVAQADQGVQLGVAQFDEGEFGGDEEAVEQDDGQDAQNAQPLCNEGVAVHLQIHLPKDDAEDVLQAEQSGLSVVGAENNGQAAAGGLHAAQGLFQAQFLGEKEGRFHVIPRQPGRVQFAGVKEPLQIDDAGGLAGFGVQHGDAVEIALPAQGEHLRHRGRGGHGGGGGHGNGDVADAEILQVEHAVDHGFFFGGQVGGRFLHDETEFLAAAEEPPVKVLPPV